jgi:hypothetical protein
MNTTFSVKYGGGSATGEIWQDYVGFAGYNVSSQAFALIEDINGDLLGQGISGLMGQFLDFRKKSAVENHRSLS